jgi:hypothetical protein
MVTSTGSISDASDRLPVSHVHVNVTAAVAAATSGDMALNGHIRCAHVTASLKYEYSLLKYSVTASHALHALTGLFV